MPILVIYLLIIGFFLGILIFFIIICPAVNVIIMRLVMPGGHLKKAPFTFDRINADIKVEKYPEAIDALNKILKQDPSNFIAVSMLSSVYRYNLGDLKSAINCIGVYLKTKKERTHGDFDLVLVYADICQECNLIGEAVALLKTEAANQFYSSTDKKDIIHRLDGIREMMLSQQ